MSLDIHQQHFKMNSDFWPQARGPPVSSAASLNFPSMMDTASSDFHSSSGRGEQAGSGFLNNNNSNNTNTNNINNNNNNDNNNVDMKEHMMSQPTDQNHQNSSFNNPTSGFAITPQHQQLQQQQPAPSISPGAENSSPEAKFNAEKIVNEIQVGGL